ncbi:MAG TPA: DUF2383 domain-containing protein [Thermoanaerobaculia bacterium]|nr:DUF2383 domain-containing protein [Thermoanaerobaculia bacterium]
MPTTTAATTNLTLLNSLLRGEMSAIETYRQALEKAGTEPGAADLHRFAKDHRDAAAQLWQHVERYGGKPSEGSGAWGAWAKTVEGTAKLFGNAAALKALKEGEEHGLKDYQDALKDEDLADDCRALIRGLIEKQREHIVALDRLISQV